MTFPDIDPILFQIGPLAIRWYSLAYIAGLLLGWAYMRCLSNKLNMGISKTHLEDFITWATVGVVVGGRLGYVFFYQPAYFFENPLDIVKVWHGGMSFHGGLLGVATVLIVFTKRNNIELLKLTDLVAVATPIGLFFGRIANFINGELYGRVTDVPWAMVFPRGGPDARHPSQLYEAVLEGLILFLVLNILIRFEVVRKHSGFLTGVFLVGYSTARATAELFREPDGHIGLLVGGSTIGQWLSAPMAIAGLSLIIWAFKTRRVGEQAAQ
ncbi:MAG: prolipoprotein diacylglyceryl transferase [Alphaproteobacteria bacterium]|nr:prolipoprotein diacylglyceryl transferase [Alphaproteobacteria bacterium]